MNRNGAWFAEYCQLYKNKYNRQTVLVEKPISFLGSSLEDLRAFPASARREAGYQLDQVQHGSMPDDWKPMPSIGPGVQEIRIRDEAGAFRVVYIAKFSQAVYVLHCFVKKTQKTSSADLHVAKKRFQALIKETKP